MCVYLCLNSKLRGGCKRDGFCFGVWLLLAYRNMVIRRKCTSVPSSHSISCEVSHFPSCSFCQLDTLFSPKQIAGYIIRPPRFCFMVTLFSPMQIAGYILRPPSFCFIDTLLSPMQIAGYFLRPPRFCFMVTLLSPMQHVGYILRPNWFCSM